MTSRSPFIRNEHGSWCPSCGEPVSSEDLDFADCSVCGFPDDGLAMARFHNMAHPLDEDDDA